MENEKVKTIDWHIHLPMDFPADWDDEMIEFYLNWINLAGVVIIWLTCLKNIVKKMDVFVVFVKQRYLRSEYMEKTITLTTSKSGDWQILEINGIEWASGHSISNVDWLGLLGEHFNCQIEVIWISDEEMEARCWVSYKITILKGVK